MVLKWALCQRLKGNAELYICRGLIRQQKQQQVKTIRESAQVQSNKRTPLLCLFFMGVTSSRWEWH